MIWRRYVKNLLAIISPKEDSVEETPMDESTHRIVDRNLYWQSELHWDLETVIKTTGIDYVTTIESSLFVKEIKGWQKRKGLDADGIIGPATWELIKDLSITPKERAVRKIMEPTIGKESGGRYWAINADGEFRGLFKNHRATGKVHIGLSFGVLQFTQDSGTLGKYLSLCAKRNPSKFKSIMGEYWDSLLTTLNKPGPSGLSQNVLRGPRVQKVPVIVDSNGTVEDRDIWVSPWVEKFVRLGKEHEFQVYQREMAEKEYLVPILKFLDSNEIRSEKMVAIAFSGAIHRGVGGMRSLLRKCLKSSLSEEELVQNVVEADPKRFKSFLTSGLSDEVWEGWNYFIFND